jgi:hypothetical protein
MRRNVAKLYFYLVLINMATSSLEELCCLGMMDVTECQDIYLRTTPNNMCDSYITRYCKTVSGKTDPMCTCINSEIPFANCHDKKCQNTGYIPNNMKNQPCPTVLNCNQYVNMTGEVQNSVVNVAQYQTCSVDADGKKQEKTTIKEIEPPPPEPTPEAEKKLTPEMMVVIAVIILVLLLGGGGILYKMNKKPVSTGGRPWAMPLDPVNVLKK